MEQEIIRAGKNYRGLEAWIRKNCPGKLLLVCGRSIRFQTELNAFFESLGGKVIRFSEFQPNPRYESVTAGVSLFRKENCCAVIGVGGGSAMDVAKCIKLFAEMEGDGADGGFLKQTIVPNRIPFLAVPTTAGTGSEATRYAVIYYNGEKQSVTQESGIPGAVLMDPACLRALPLYQKKATMLDALCHAVESFWSVNSMEESKQFSRSAVRGVLEHMDGYLANTDEGNSGMLLAANLAGKAINITQTTAGHAMCYKITTLFGTSHGHAAALCCRELFPHMTAHTELCIDPRGAAYLKDTLDELGRLLGGTDAESGALRFAAIFDGMELEVPSTSDEQFAVLKRSVNPVRLKNHPVRLDEETIDSLYRRILKPLNPLL